MKTCGRCKQPPGRAETCWYCNGDLCVKCWDEVGHCGHEEAEIINAAARRMNGDGRLALARALGATVGDLPTAIDFDEN